MEQTGQTPPADNIIIVTEDIPKTANDNQTRPRSTSSINLSKDKLLTAPLQHRARSRTVGVEETKDEKGKSSSELVTVEAIPENDSFAYFRRTDREPKFQRKILYALNQRHILSNKLKPTANKTIQDATTKGDKSGKRLGFGSKINALLRNKKQKRTRTGIFHSLTIAVMDRQVIESCALLDLLSDATLIKKRPQDANRIFLNAMINRLQTVCIHMMEKGFPQNVNSSIFKPVNPQKPPKFTFPSYFQLACSFGLDQLCKTMIKFKADPNLSWYQVTPLQIACVQGNDQMIQLLLQCGANVNQTLGLADLCLLNRLKSHVPKSSNGSAQNGSPESPSPFKDAFRQYGQKGPITFPQEFINEKEILLYELALASGHETVALQLIELASKAVIAKSSFGLLLSKQINITKLLLHAGVKVDLKDGCGSTALHIAVRRGNLDVVIALVLNGADINCSGFNGWTPLHEAISYSHVLVTHYLLYKSADPSIKNDQGETPVDLAKRIGMDEATIDTLFNQPPDKTQFLEKEKNISAIEISSLANTQMDSPGRPKNEKSKFGLNFLNRTNSGAPVQNVESVSRTSLNKPQKRGIFGKASKSNMNL